jgi:hypothetical protein
MTQAQQPLNPWIMSYINEQRHKQSRYEIDKFLLDAGCNPVDIELAWQNLEHASSPLADTPAAQPNLITRICYIIAAVIFVIIMFSSIEMGLSFNFGLFFLALYWLVYGLAPAPHSKLVKRFLIITMTLGLLVSVGGLTYYIIR